LEQEAIALSAAQLHGFAVSALRLGVVFGPGRLWTARLGVANGPILLQFGLNARLPLTFVEHCAEAVVLSAEKDEVISDVYVDNDGCGRKGGFEMINVIDDDQPTQQQYTRMIRNHADFKWSIVVPLPWAVLKTIAAVLSYVALFWPGMVSKLPGILRPASMNARIKPLRYSNARLHDRLDWSPKLNCNDAIMLSGWRRTGTTGARFNCQ